MTMPDFDQCEGQPDAPCVFRGGECKFCGRAFAEPDFDQWCEAQHAVTIDINDHRTVYRSVAEELEVAELAGAGDGHMFPTPEDEQRAIETGNLIVIHWSPDTPVGSITIAASSLALAKSFAMEISAEDRKRYPKKP